jgi:MurNAc alpha-1-phosphate uridylyltransferase
MVLAAGRGERMRPLTDTTPKPLLTVRGQPLMQWPMQALARGGFTRLLVNTAWLGEQIPAHFGDRVALPGAPEVQITYSHEGQDFGQALETAGGIVRALPQLDEVFWVVAGDVFAPEFVFTPEALQRFAASPALAHLLLVPNPAHNPGGDFGLSPEGMALNLPKSGATSSQTTRPLNAIGPGPLPHAAQPPIYTFSTIALYKRTFFEAAWCPIPSGNPEGVKAPLAAMLRAAMDQGLVSASIYEGLWADVGTPERLALLNA